MTKVYFPHQQGKAWSFAWKSAKRGRKVQLGRSTQGVWSVTVN